METQIQNVTVYKILEYLNKRKFEGYDFADLDSLRDLIKEEAPITFEQFESDNYDGPGDNYYQQ